ncbi:MAG: hypothetical protein MUO18_02475, partial [Methanomassiliicoccales archaeon]|nr:hypothetical protein [Methanomassiliicoccales archaeon]
MWARATILERTVPRKTSTHTFLTALTADWEGLDFNLDGPPFPRNSRTQTDWRGRYLGRYCS